MNLLASLQGSDYILIALDCDFWRIVSEDSRCFTLEMFSLPCCRNFFGTIPFVFVVVVCVESSVVVHLGFPADRLQPWHFQSLTGLAWHTQMFQHTARFCDSLFFPLLFVSLAESQSYSRR